MVQYEFLQKVSIPVVFIDWTISDPRVSYVSLDDIEGGFQAVTDGALRGYQAGIVVVLLDRNIVHWPQQGEYDFGGK